MFSGQAEGKYIERSGLKQVLIKAHALASSAQVETYIPQVNAYFVLGTNYIFFNCHASSMYHVATDDRAHH